MQEPRLTRRAAIVAAVATPFAFIGVTHSIARQTASTPVASPGASPMASPGAAGVAMTEVTIAAYDIYFDPKEVTIAANTSVTVHLPNKGAALHNFSINDRKNPGLPNLGIEVDISPGEEQTITINAQPGDYYFYCDIPGHEEAGMFGTLHVVAA